jgi:deferrochelatase/peroxidase EfeB
VSDELSRRALLGGLGTAGLALGAAAAAASPADAAVTQRGDTVPFFGRHQAGIATPPPEYFALLGLDVTTTSVFLLRAFLNRASDAAQRLTRGQSLGTNPNPYGPPLDTGEAMGRGPANLTITIGYGPSLFDDRFGLAARRPAALETLPSFAGDALDPQLSDGDIVLQFCSDDPQVNFHAAHTVERLAYGVATLRYFHVGFGRTSSTSRDQVTPRNLLGFKDGTDNLQVDAPRAYAAHVWARHGEPAYMVGGTYLVQRKIRVALESWSANSLDAQESLIGRRKVSGAPLTSQHEHDRPDLHAVDASGVHVIADNAHVRVAGPAANLGRRLLRRGFGFVDGLDPTTGQFSAGLHFVCFQKNPGEQFVPIQQNIALNDGLAPYLTTVASAVAACPRGLRRGEGWGDQLVGA